MHCLEDASVDVPNPFLIVFGGRPLANLTRVPASKIRFFCCHGNFLLSETFQRGFWAVFRFTFKRSEGFFFLFGVAFPGIFERATVVVALCTSVTHCRHFASSLPRPYDIIGISNECVDLLFLLKWLHVIPTCLFACLCYFQVYPTTGGLWR